MQRKARAWSAVAFLHSGKWWHVASICRPQKPRRRCRAVSVWPPRAPPPGDLGLMAAHRASGADRNSRSHTLSHGAHMPVLNYTSRVNKKCFRCSIFQIGRDRRLSRSTGPRLNRVSELLQPLVVASSSSFQSSPTSGRRVLLRDRQQAPRVRLQACIRTTYPRDYSAPTGARPAVAWVRFMPGLPSTGR